MTRVRVIVEPTEPQERFLALTDHVRGFVGGYGAGKSFTLALDIIRRPRSQFPVLLMANGYRMLVDVMAATILEVAGGYASLHKDDMTIRLPQGRVYLRSSLQPDLWRGLNARSGAADELAFASEAGLQQFLARLRGNPWAFSTTPDKSSPLYEMVVGPALDGRYPVSYGEVSAPTESNTNNGATYGAQMRAALGSRLALQDVDGLWADVDGGLWTKDDIVHGDPPRAAADRYVIGVDPNAGGKDEVGIVTVGIWGNLAWVVEDDSGKFGADVWPQIVVDRWRSLKRCTVVAEVNQGGDMVERVIRVLDPAVRYVGVRALKSKEERAGPVVAMYRQQLVQHARRLPELEKEQRGWDPRAPGARSPNRLDALVWALIYADLQTTSPQRTAAASALNAARPAQLTRLRT